MIKVKKSLYVIFIAFIILNIFIFAQSSDASCSSHVDEKGCTVTQCSDGSGSTTCPGVQDMMESKARMERKETFSYENEVVEHRYDAGPSYAGYSKEQMIFGLVFEQIGDDIDPREIKQDCNDPNKIADIVISRLKEKVGDIQKLCGKFEDKELNCNEQSRKMCSQIGIPVVRENANEMKKIQSVAFSCPVNKDAIVEACRHRSKSYLEQQIKNIDESCEKRASFDQERMEKECKKLKQYQVCDKDKYIQQCLNNFGVIKENFDESGKRKPICQKYPVPSCGEGMKLETKTDENGCQYYYCGTAQQTVCTQEAKLCPDGSYVARVAPNCEFQQCPTTVCPTPTEPKCDAGSTVQKKVDEKGCVYYYCQASTAVCAADVQQCPDGSYVKRVSPSCNFEQCPTTTVCPAAIEPKCEAGSTVQKKVDERGCVYYYCSTPTCPTVTKPICNTGETIQAYYDNAGCITSYQCIKQQTICPEPTKPACTQDQSLTTKYDQNKCVSYECVTITTTSNSSSITGSAVLETYGDYVSQCESNWHQQEKVCQNMQSSCGASDFVERCKEQALNKYGEFKSRMEETCQSQTISQIRAAEDRCSRINSERNRCAEETAKRCGQMKGLMQNCKEILSEDNLRKFILEEAKKRCKFTDIIQNEEDVRNADKVEIVLAVLNRASESDLDKLSLFVENLKEDLRLQDTTVYKGTIDPNRFGDIRLMPFVVNAKISAPESSERAKEVKEKIVARQKTEEVASKLVSLRDSDVPSQYLYIIEDKANDVLNVSDKLGEIDEKEKQKGFGYKFRLFLGLARQAEQEEIKQLQESNSKLKNSIDTLTKLTDEVPSDVAKSILKEQVESLKKQKADIEVLIETKEKKAKGFFGIFG